MIATTIEQSKKLVQLGIDISTADMYYPYLGDNVYSDIPRVGEAMPYSSKHDIHAWSLSALMELLPRSIKSEKNGQTYLSIHRGYEDNWAVEYSFDDIDRDYLEIKFEDRNPIDAAFEMIIWLKENKYI